MRLLLGFLFVMATFGQPGFPDLGWMAGEWAGEKWGGRLEEVWTKNPDGSLMCAFRHVKEGKPVFYEFLTLEMTEGKPVLWMRHFNSRLQAWEDKNGALRFDLTSAKTNEVVFELLPENANGLRVKMIYRLAAPGRMDAVLERTKDGKTSVENFEYRKR